VRENVMPRLSEPTLASRSAFSLTRAPSVAELLRRARACRTGPLRAMVFSILVALFDAWVLLIEINR
jgi:hypothetical protein